MRRRMGLVIVLLLTLLIVACNGINGDEGQYQTITPEDALEAINGEENVVLLDVRTPEEYAGCRLAWAQNLPLSQLEDQIDTYAETKDTKIIVYCQTGNRSQTASNLLLNLGYTNVYDLGGIEDWPYLTQSDYI